MDKVVPADAGQRPRVTPWYLQLWFLVLVAMAGGIALGQLYPEIGARMEPLGNAFIKAVRVLIAPIIFCTVVHGISSMARMAKVGRVALKALIYFEVLTTVALVIGLLAVNLFQPGGGMNVDLSHVDTWSVAPYLEQTHSRTTAQFLLDIIPHTFVGALSEGNVLQVLYVSVTTIMPSPQVSVIAATRAESRAPARILPMTNDQRARRNEMKEGAD